MQPAHAQNTAVFVGTSGVVLLARTEAAHRSLSEAFQNRRVRKTYRALVWGRPEPADGLYEDPVGRDPSDGRRVVERSTTRGYSS